MAPLQRVRDEKFIRYRRLGHAYRDRVPLFLGVISRDIHGNNFRYEATLRFAALPSDSNDFLVQA